jgi:RNA polymerase sigma-70 factor, ECF subfamily
MSDPSDDELIAAHRRGDAIALDTLLRRHHPRILTLCRSLCRTRGDAEDAAQNALLAIVRGLDGFDGRSRFTTWSHRVTANACLDELRRTTRRPVPASDDTHDEVATPGPGPAQRAEGATTRVRLRAALDELPEEFREAVLLRDVADMEYGEIAEVLSLSGGTVRSRIARGRARLARSLASDPLVGNRSELPDVQTDEPS